MTVPIIRVHEFSVAYDASLVLDEVDFECQAGQFVSIVGMSGCGKSTFLNALAGFIPYRGTKETPDGFGYVFQKHALFPWMTVEKNIGFALGDHTEKFRRERTRELLVRIQMESFGKRYPSELSGGQVQRVSLARALAQDPAVLLMDEPYGALDHHTRDRMQNWLLSVWSGSKKTVLFVTHYIEEAIFLSDRVVVLRDKKFVADLAVPFPRPRQDDLRFAERFLDMKHEILDFMENMENQA